MTELRFHLVIIYCGHNEFYSRLWGGAYNIIVPTNGQKIDERFWTLLDLIAKGRPIDPDKNTAHWHANSGLDRRIR